ncbi:hypothetical protein CHEID_08130 [Corynebacterium heidelbergense]|uniref:UPF0182 protein CWC39_07835 n=1 Tax=Corynebacterium heidelbergense TaxID=2055947 RepID=A0A364VA69_9CORY|nr:membrane protein [Corynebacterium heidelbergense]WCZ37156.1 hypothetical protein CHEID_08130 [Corynebacterium heidelbergense]
MTTTPGSASDGNGRGRAGRASRAARFVPSKRSKLLGIVAAVVAAAFLIIPIVVSVFTDFQWFRSISYQGVYVGVIITRAVLFFVFGVLAALAAWLATWAAYRRRPHELTAITSASPLSAQRSRIARNVRPLLVGFPISAGLAAGLIAQGNWRTALLWVNGGDFGVQDPQFHRDLGFYAFDLPMLQFVVHTLSLLLIMAFIVNAVLHYLLGSITTGNPRVGEKASISPAARRQLAFIAGLWMLNKAANYWLQRYSLMNRNQGTFTGASYTDINAVLPAQIVLLVISLFVAALFFFTLVVRDLRIPALGVALMVASSLTVGIAWPAALEQFSVAPNRAEREREYIGRNIEMTRFAYGIGDDNVTYERDWGAKQPDNAEAKRKSIAKDEATISNIRLLDPDVLSPTFTQQQQLRNFYGFPDELSIDRYEVNGQMRDFVVAARELNPQTLTGNQNDWINRHTVYTHGNGFIAAPARKVDEVARDAGSSRGGYPVYTVADLQSLDRKDQGGELKLDLKQPRIYFGPLIASSSVANSDYAIAGNRDAANPMEFDTDTKNYTYEGDGGVDVSNPINRLMYSIHFQSMNMLLTDRIGEGSRILYERDPRERVHKVAPWLTTDSKTYPIVDGGRIKWVVDGYTTLQNLPYAQRTSLTNATADRATPNGVAQTQLVNDQVSYIRNSVKAVVDSYDGSVDLYAFDDEDPVLKAWMGAFPGVVKPRSEISEQLMSHLRYPEDMFKTQRELISKYHVSDPSVFFQNDAFWSVPADPTAPEGKKELNQPPYYVVAADPRTKQPSYQLTTAFVGLRRDFLAAQMSVSSDPESYGKINVRVLPTGTQTQGPRQAQDTMMSSDRAAQERTLLKGTTTLTNGNLLTLPVGDGQILYVEPVYAKRADQASAFPKLLRVLVTFNGQVGYAPTIAEALSQVGINPAAASDAAQAGAGNAAAGGGNGGQGDQGDRPENRPENGTTPPNSSVSSAAAQRVREAMDRVKQARQNGSFEEFGKALDELDAAVSDLQKQQG